MRQGSLLKALGMLGVQWKAGTQHNRWGDWGDLSRDAAPRAMEHRKTGSRQAAQPRGPPRIRGPSLSLNPVMRGEHRVWVHSTLTESPRLLSSYLAGHSMRGIRSPQFYLTPPGPETKPEQTSPTPSNLEPPAARRLQGGPVDRAWGSTETPSAPGSREPFLHKTPAPPTAPPGVVPPPTPSPVLESSVLRFMDA